MTYSKEDYEYLSKFEFHLRSAVDSNYCRIDARNTLGEFDTIYQRAFGRKSKLTNGCNRCVLENIKELAKAYFEDKRAYEAQEKPIDLIDENCGTTISKTTKNAPAPKKTKNKKK